MYTETTFIYPFSCNIPPRPWSNLPVHSDLQPVGHLLKRTVLVISESFLAVCPPPAWVEAGSFRMVEENYPVLGIIKKKKVLKKQSQLYGGTEPMRDRLVARAKHWSTQPLLLFKGHRHLVKGEALQVTLAVALTCARSSACWGHWSLWLLAILSIVGSPSSRVGISCRFIWGYKTWR